MPTEAPTSPGPARGLSMTRWLPNVRWRSSVTRKTPPSTPTSSPMIMMSGSRSISCIRATLRALTMLSRAMVTRPGRRSSARQPLAAHGCGGLLAIGLGRGMLAGGHLAALLGGGSRRFGVGVVEHRERVGRRRRLEALHGGRDLGVDGLLQAFLEEIPLFQIGREAGERVLALPLLDLGLRPVFGGIVGGGVHGQPVGHALDERRPVAGAGALHRRAAGLVHGEHVVAIHLHARKSVGQRLLGYGARMGL